MIILTSPADILEAASTHVLETLSKNLDQEVLFHNQRHTVQCIHAVQEIGEAIQLSSKENLAVRLATWFLNMGYIQDEVNPIEASITLLHDFLEANEIKDVDVDLAIECLRGIEQSDHRSQAAAVVHDAYWYFLAASNHLEMCDRMRAEWASQNRTYDDLGWRDYVCDLYKRERYVTSYGRKVLEKRKQVNYYMCLTRLYGSIAV